MERKKRKKSKKITRKIKSGLITTLLLSITLTRCANIGMPMGGPSDTIPPVVVAVVPPYGTTNFDEKRIYIEFDEYVSIKDQQKEFFTSPIMERKPTLTVKGKGVQITIEEDTLRDNTTYALNFGSSIADNNEGNPYHGLRYVFSTGSEVDSMIMSGYAVDAYKKDSIPKAFIFFYDAAKDTIADYDSTLFNLVPDAVARAQDNGVFVAENLKPIPYRVYAIEDNNNNQKYEPKVDKVGFMDGLYNPAEMEEFRVWFDTISHYVVADPQIYIRMFTDELFARQYLATTQRPSQHKIVLGFNAVRPTIVNVEVEGLDSTKLIKEYLSRDKDSIAYWLNTPSEQLPDTLIARVTYMKHDSLMMYVESVEEFKLGWKPILTKEEQKKEQKKITETKQQKKKRKIEEKKRRKEEKRAKKVRRKWEKTNRKRVRKGLEPLEEPEEARVREPEKKQVEGGDGTNVDVESRGERGLERGVEGDTVALNLIDRDGVLKDGVEGEEQGVAKDTSEVGVTTAKESDSGEMEDAETTQQEKSADGEEMDGKKKSEEEEEKNPFKYSVGVTGEVNPERNIPITFDVPLIEIDSAAISLVRVVDDKKYKIKTTIEQDTANIRVWTIKGQWMVGQKYEMLIPAGAFTNVQREQNDTLKANFSVMDPDKHAVLVLNIVGKEPESEYVLQLMDQTGNTMLQERRHATTGKYVFKYVPAGDVKVRVVEDMNRDGEWSGGDMVKRMQPEYVKFFTTEGGEDKIPTKGGWELVYDIDMTTLFSPQTMQQTIEELKRAEEEKLIKHLQEREQKEKQRKDQGREPRSEMYNPMGGAGGIGGIGTGSQQPVTPIRR